MPTVQVPLTTFAIRAAAAGRAHGQVSKLGLRQGSAGEIRVPRDQVPDGATVQSAEIALTHVGENAGTRTVRLRAIDGPWGSRVTWNNRPDVAPPTVEDTRTGMGRGDKWRFDITSYYQDVVSGVRPDRGWQITTVEEWQLDIAGSLGREGSWAPVMEVEYTLLPEAPEELHPADALVSSNTPTLTFSGDDDLIALQVQVDPAMDEVSPLWDSGVVASAGPLLRLSEMGFPGWFGSVYWRARQETAAGWSEWSEWVEMTYSASDALTITSPGATTSDPTPPVIWDFAGTQTAWRARLVADDGRVVADSDYTPGTDAAWTPPRGPRRDGWTGFVEVRIWDDVDRVATPGAPEYVRATQAITYEASATIAPVTGLSAATAPGVPEAVLTGSRGEVPDELVLFRDGVRVGEWVGPDVFDGAAFEIRDERPPANRPVAYQVAARVNGEIGDLGDEVTVTVRAEGAWLSDIETGDRVLVFYNSEGYTPEQTAPERAVVHEPLPIGDESLTGVPVVRRRLARALPSGTLEGVVADVEGWPGAPSAEDSERLLNEWTEADAGRRFWLVFGRFAGEVIVGDIVLTERNDPVDMARIVGVSLSWWGQQ